MTKDKLIELAERAVDALERIAGALTGEQRAPLVPDEVLVADLRMMSLRAVARKHGVGVGRVRGAALRARSA